MCKLILWFMKLDLDTVRSCLVGAYTLELLQPQACVGIRSRAIYSAFRHAVRYTTRFNPKREALEVIVEDCVPMLGRSVENDSCASAVIIDRIVDNAKVFSYDSNSKTLFLPGDCDLFHMFVSLDGNADRYDVYLER